MIGRWCGTVLLACGLFAGQAQQPGGGADAAAAFEVASVRPSAYLNTPEMQAAMRAGNIPKFGVNIDGLRAEYNQMQLRDLIANAYDVKPYQVTGPDFLNGQRFDIAAKMPEGTTAADAPAMLRALLQARFQLRVTTSTEDRQVLALVVGRSGPKMKPVAAPPPIDWKAELKPGERKMDTGDGPAILSIRQSSGGGMGAMTMNMGSKGIMTNSFKMDGQAFTMHLEFSGVTMPALAVMLSQILTQGPGGGEGKPVVDRTGLTGNYDTTLDFAPQSFAPESGGSGGSASTAPDPEGNGASSIYQSVEKMGLKLEPARAPVKQVMVAHIERAPTEN